MGRVAATAVPLTLRSLALRLEIGSPEVPTDLHWLSRQRLNPLGADAFRALVATHLKAESLTDLLTALDQFDAAQQQAAPDRRRPPHPPTGRGLRAALRRVFQRR